MLIAFFKSQRTLDSDRDGDDVYRGIEGDDCGTNVH